MASSERRAQIPIRIHGGKNCPHHIGKEVVYVCEKCGELACVTCVSTVHKNHELVELGNIIPNAELKLQDFIEISEQQEIPRIKGNILDVNQEISKKKHYYEQQISQAEKQNKIIKGELDKATSELVKSYRDIKEKETGMLYIHKTALEATIDDRSTRIQECKERLESNNNIRVYDVSRDIPSEHIPTTAIPKPNFTPGQFSETDLHKLFNDITSRISRIDYKPSPKAVSYCAVSQFVPYKHHGVKSIRPASNYYVWINVFSFTDKKPINKLLLVSWTGRVQDSLGVFDFCLSPRSGIPWFIGHVDNSVREAAVEGGSVVRFRTDRPAESICLTADDHVVIGHVGKVVKYTQIGKIINATPGGDEPLVLCPWNISECPKTAHLAVVDMDLPKYRGTGHPMVWILDDKLNPLYRYVGDSAGGQSPSPSFYPCGASFTDDGNLVVTDHKNKSVLMANDIGEHLQTMYTHSDSKPLGVCVHNDGIIWVSF